MKAMNQKPVLFVLLLGTLTFTLSALPGQAAAGGSRSMASLEVESSGNTAYDYEQKIKSSPSLSAHTNVDTKVDDEVQVTGHVNVSVTSVANKNYLDSNPDQGSKRYIMIDMKLETECPTCDSGYKSIPVKAQLPIDEISELNGDIEKLIRGEAKKLAAPVIEAKKKAQEVKEKNEKIAKCEDGTEEAKLKCNVERMHKSTDAEAAQIFKDSVRPGLDARLNSSDPAKRKEGKELLAQIKKNGAGGDIVRDESEALDHISIYEDRADAIQKKINEIKAVNPTDSRLLTLQQLAQQNAIAAGGYFNNLSSYNQLHPYADSTYGDLFGADLNSWQAALSVYNQGLIAQAQASAQAIYNLTGTQTAANTPANAPKPGFYNPLFAQQTGLLGTNSAAVPATAALGNTQFPGAPAAAVKTAGH